MRSISSLRSFLLSTIVLLASCHSAGSSLKGNVAATDDGEQIARVVAFEQIRYVMVRGQLQPTINPNYDLNAAYYLCGQCIPGSTNNPGKMGLYGGAVVQTARFGTVGPNWVEFRYDGDGAYVEVNDHHLKDKTNDGPANAIYRLVFDDDRHARILFYYTNQGGFPLTDAGYRMTYDSDTGEWQRFTAAPRDVNDSKPDYEYTPGAKEHYRLLQIYTADNKETKFTEEFINDQDKSAVASFVVKVALTDPLATGELPTGPFRDPVNTAAASDADSPSQDTADMSNDSPERSQKAGSSNAGAVETSARR